MLYVLSGPSGVGKARVTQCLKDRQVIELVVSHTTREPRAGEVDGTHYHFVTRGEFLDMVSKDVFLEYKEYNDNLYGTSRLAVRFAERSGRPVLLEIEVHGAKDVRFVMGDEARMIFLLPPSATELTRRLSNRGTESDDDVRRRLRIAARSELPFAPGYDAWVVNHEVEQAADDIEAFMEGRPGNEPDPLFLASLITEIQEIANQGP